MIANTITLFRVFLTFLVIALLGHHAPLDIALIFTIALSFSLDAVDGIVARKRNEVTKTGALLDTVADRIVENAFWIYFAAARQIPLWMPIVVMARGIITDTMQRTHGDPTDGWTHALTRSRISRGLYGVIKMLAFISLATATVFNHDALETLSLTLATSAVFFCLLRGFASFFHKDTSSTENVTRVSNRNPKNTPFTRHIFAITKSDTSQK